jgi:hypothetical protein
MHMLNHDLQASFPLGISLATAKILFLGDYVDRGPHSVEVALHLLCLKARETKLQTCVFV